MAREQHGTTLALCNSGNGTCRRKTKLGPGGDSRERLVWCLRNAWIKRAQWSNI